MEGLLRGKTAIITGAGSGVGRAASLIFSAHGAQLVCADINAAAAAETVDLVRAAGGTAEAYGCDVSDEAAVGDLFDKAVATFGRLDIVYNNAGISSPSGPDGRALKLIDNTAEQMERLQAVNVKGVVNGCRAAVRLFQSQGGGGVIVNTASVAGLVGWGGSYYGLTKGAIIALTRSLAMEVAPSNIRINSVCPAAMLTNFGGMMTKDGPISGEALKQTEKIHPLGRLIAPEDCANAALFLASDLAANITGVNLPVDGGVSAGR